MLQNKGLTMDNYTRSMVDEFGWEAVALMLLDREPNKDTYELVKEVIEYGCQQNNERLAEGRGVSGRDHETLAQDEQTTK